MKRRLVLAAASLGVALLVPLGLVAVPASAQAAPASCPTVLFLGLHGVNEGGTTGERDVRWGGTIEKVWSQFQTQVSSAAPEPVNYGKTQVDITVPWNAAKIEPDANHAADLLRARLLDERHDCEAKTQIVVAGYSQGAWAVDKALRNMQPGRPTSPRSTTLSASS